MIVDQVIRIIEARELVIRQTDGPSEASPGVWGDSPRNGRFSP